mmetsp:Transcript_29061/g.41104  ORF Transcript_29061/g.41104 Transcript_29061/m.41104 type:complete len:290 (+) Transcript_29061:591-1460(+)|eukprot:CAMPEP_0202475958 /NCGR_PEP_ID=MMETSP1360-20130828/93171_1 /ASSEMBLY_ACC=CAM_ASM_000848 /TAXON_ID=515479 /ORGANISM="Licmophora paradoxa, Strain CCMP2313" /LENGTH=289 /DNA_ID=CAMNT_0049103141 /DNA_START=1201 /DNA_END=2070 /DNA_ORIENTATION=+
MKRSSIATIISAATVSMILSNTINGVSATTSTNTTTTNETVIFTEESIINCTLCEDASAPFDLSAIFVAGDETLSCQTAYDRGTIPLPESNCSFFQNRGATICRCGAPLSQPTDCSLCEDGSPLPNPLLEGPVPGESCAALAVDARRDSAENCIVHQGTVGTYCGCVNPVADAAVVCRICGTILLPVPTKTVQAGDGMVASCGQLEFLANANANAVGGGGGSAADSCSSFQDLYFEECCSDTSVPTAAPTSGANMIPSFVPSSMNIAATSSAAQHAFGFLLLSFCWFML